MSINILCYVHKGYCVFIFTNFHARLCSTPDFAKNAVFHYIFSLLLKLVQTILQIQVYRFHSITQNKKSQAS